MYFLRVVGKIGLIPRDKENSSGKGVGKSSRYLHGWGRLRKYSYLLPSESGRNLKEGLSFLNQHSGIAGSSLHWTNIFFFFRYFLSQPLCWAREHKDLYTPCLFLIKIFIGLFEKGFFPLVPIVIKKINIPEEQSLPSHSLSLGDLHQLIRTQVLHWGALAHTATPPYFPPNTSLHPEISPHIPVPYSTNTKSYVHVISSRYYSMLSNTEWPMLW